MKVPHTRSGPAAAFVLVGVLLLQARLAAASAGYLKIGAVAGESTAAGHVGWIEVDPVRWQTVPPAVPPGPAPAGVAKGGPGIVGLTKKVDKASPALQKAALTGQQFPAATLEVPGGTAGGSLKYELKNVMVSSIHAGGGGGGQPTEQFTLNFSAVELQYPAQATPTPRNWSAHDKTEGSSAPAGAGASGAALRVLSLPPAVTRVTPGAVSALTGATVTFTVEATGDCNRSRIDFGDGSPVVEYPIVAGKSQPAPTHAYAKGGT
ncbi:MAG TPA: type VI secretion system tube protein Hcp, partial [Vicinamibacterales bacterium]